MEEEYEDEGWMGRHRAGEEEVIDKNAEKNAETPK